MTAGTTTPKGRAVGSTLPGSLAAWLKAASVGDVYWTDKGMNGLISQAGRVGRKIELRRFYAVADDLTAVRLTRITVVA